MKNPLVVGYRGEIGSYILAGLIKYMPKALDILCFDLHETIKECKDRIRKADVIFLCVPAEKTPWFFLNYHKELDGKVVVEQTSLKAVLFDCENIRSYISGVEILSMHLLFRPSATPNVKDRNIALIEPKKWMRRKRIENFVKSLASGVHLYSRYMIMIWPINKLWFTGSY